MKRALAHLLLVPALLLIAACSMRAAQLGDPAAPLEIAEWIKGEPVGLAAVKGKKIVVVEFWATWCGPCLTSIPHLTEMQRKFASRGVVFIGVSDESSSKVRPFVDKMGEKMDYTVAIDRDRKTSEGYMKTFGVNGIPHAFIVDKEGRIAWHGHPMAGLDKALDRMAANTFDLGTEKKRDSAQRKLEEYFELASTEGNAEQLDKLGVQLAALDKELGGINPGDKLDLAALRKSARFQSVMRDYQRALTSGRNEAELAKLEEKAAPLAPAGFKFAEFKGQFQLQRVFQEYYRAVTRPGNEARIPELTRQLEGIESSNAEMQNEIAWTILSDEKIKTRNLPLAMKFARAAFTASEGRDAGILDTYARALFDSGKVAEAVEQQRRAVELCDDPEKKAELKDTLQRYQAKVASK